MLPARAATASACALTAASSKGINLCRLSHAADGTDLLGHVVETLQGPTREVDPGPFPGEGAGHCAADRASAPIPAIKGPGRVVRRWRVVVDRGSA
jgi:hypothetical protein